MGEPFDRLKAALADNYILEREIGTGGMATVFLALDARHNRKVAIKVMRREVAALTCSTPCRCSIPAVSTAERITSCPASRANRFAGRFLMTRLPVEQRRPRIALVLNWFDELRAKVPQ